MKKMKNSWLAAVASATIAMGSMPASADDIGFRTVQYRPMVQATIACPINLLCVLRLEPGEQIRNGLNSQIPSWESNDVYEGSDVQTPLLTFKPVVAGLRANVLVTTTRRSYIILLESTNGDRPTYIRFGFDAEAKSRRAARVAMKPSPPPPTLVEQFTAACSWMQANSPGEQYAEDAKPIHLRPARVCHDDRMTWISLPPVQVAAIDLPVVLEVTPQGERIVNYQLFATERIIRVDGVADGYVLRGGGKESMHVVRRKVKVSPVALASPDSTLSGLLRGPRDAR